MNHVVDLLDDEKKETLLEESVIVEVPTEDRDWRPTKTRRDGEIQMHMLTRVSVSVDDFSSHLTVSIVEGL